MQQPRDAVKIAGIIALGFCLPSPAGAQLPEEFHNLKVLPQDIAQRELIGVMKSFSRGLGVRCAYCHVGDEQTQSLWEFDFVSDEKPTKEAARVMLRMMREINREHLPRIGKKAPELLEVQCITCHRGQARPLSLAQTLEAAVRADGLEAGLQKYAELRERHYGSHTFDFGPRSLQALVRNLKQQNQPAAALAFAKLNIEHFPEMASNYILLGDLQLESGDKAAAIASYQKAKKLNPDNPLPQQKLDQLSGEAGQS